MSEKETNDLMLIEKLQKLLKAGNRTLNHYPYLVKAALLVKLATTLANKETGALSAVKAEAIEKACRQALGDISKVNIPINIYRSLGAPLNLAISDYLARAASTDRLTVTRDDLLINQADADVTATIKTLVVRECITPLLEAGHWFADLMDTKANEFKDVIKTSRSNLRDGLPVSLGDEFKAYSVALRDSLVSLQQNQLSWNESALGLGEAGTGLGSTQAFQKAANSAITSLTGFDWQSPANALVGLDGAQKLVLTHAHIQSIALVLWRTAHDLGLLCSGPRGGIREIAFPAVAPGSSIMPGKINPTVAELAMLVSDNILSNQWASTLGVHSGWLGATPSSTLPIKTLMDSCDLLARTLEIFGKKVIQGITAFPDRALKQAQSSLALARALDYFCTKEDRRKVQDLAKNQNLTCLQAAKELKVLPDSALDEILNPVNLINTKRVENLLVRFAELRNKTK